MIVKSEAWIVDHPFFAFLLINFALTWSLWLLMPAPSPGEIPVQFLAGSFGPALAAMLVSGVVNPKTVSSPRSKRWIAFGLLLVAGVGVIWLSRAVLFAGDYGMVWIATAALAVVLAAFVVSMRYASNEGIRRLLGSILDWRKSLGWYALVFLLIPATYGVSLQSFEPLTGRTLPPMPYQGPIGDLPVAVLAAFALRLFFGGANEEPGWRGFAIPQLQKSHSPLMASVIVALFWGLWHLPLHLNGVYSSGWMGLAQVAARMIMGIPFSILMTWVFNRSGGSLLLVMLLHAANNTTPQFLLPGFIEQLLMWLAAAIVLFRAKMWRKPRIMPGDALPARVGVDLA